jgi:hypothetical protein
VGEPNWLINYFKSFYWYPFKVSNMYYLSGFELINSLKWAIIFLIGNYYPSSGVNSFYFNVATYV